MSKMIECKDLVMQYEGNVAVGGISFTLDEGDFLVILGENGSGKSTLIKGLLGLKPVSGGSIRFTGLKQTEIGYLPQQTAAQRDFPATVTEVVRSGCLNKNGWRPYYTRAQKLWAKEAIEKMKLGELAKRCYRELSGGQQQRTLLARALCATEKLLLLDEPVSGLDPVVTSELYDTIQKLNRENMVTVIMITHDVAGAMELANKVLHIESGNHFFGTAQEYRKTPLYRSMKGVCHHD